MLLINREPGAHGGYSSQYSDMPIPQALIPDTMIEVPAHLVEKTRALLPWIIPTIETVTETITRRVEKTDGETGEPYLDEVVETIEVERVTAIEPGEKTTAYLEQITKSRRTVKLGEVGAACTAAIHAGIEVEGKRYSLTEHDQIELLAQLNAVKLGAPAVPYHADGELCRMFTAEEFVAVADAAMAFIFYHRTYCNHLNSWIRGANAETLDKISYGAELPKKLARSMADLLASAAGGDGDEDT